MIEPCHQPDELIKIDVPVSVLINDAHHVLIVLTSKVLMINPCGHLQFLLFWIPSKSSHHLLKLLHSNGSSAISVKEREYFSVFCQLFWGQIFYDLQRQSLRYQTIKVRASLLFSQEYLCQARPHPPISSSCDAALCLKEEGEI